MERSTERVRERAPFIFRVSIFFSHNFSPGQTPQNVCVCVCVPRYNQKDCNFVVLLCVSVSTIAKFIVHIIKNNAQCERALRTHRSLSQRRETHTPKMLRDFPICIKSGRVELIRDYYYYYYGSSIFCIYIDFTVWSVWLPLWLRCAPDALSDMVAKEFVFFKWNQKFYYSPVRSRADSVVALIAWIGCVSVCARASTNFFFLPPFFTNNLISKCASAHEIE